MDQFHKNQEVIASVDGNIMAYNEDNVPDPVVCKVCGGEDGHFCIEEV